MANQKYTEGRRESLVQIFQFYNLMPTLSPTLSLVEERCIGDCADT